MKNAGKSVSELCNEFDLKTQTVYAWCKKYNSPQEKTKLEQAPLSESEKENIELKNQLKQLKMENDILKQAALIFGKKVIVISAKRNKYSIKAMCKMLDISRSYYYKLFLAI